VTGGGQSTITRKHLVDRAQVEAISGQLAVLNRHEVNHGHFHEKLLGITLSKLIVIVVPFAALEIETIGHTTSFGFLCDIRRLQVRLDDVAEGNLVDSNGVLSREVLLCASEESLREEESRHPEACWGAVIIPISQESDSFVAIDNPGCERLETQEAFTFTFIAPHGWNLIVVDRCRHLLQILRHDKLTNKSFLNLDKTDLHLCK